MEDTARARARDRVTFRAGAEPPGHLGKRPATAGRSQLSTRGSALSILARHLRASPYLPPPTPRLGDPLGGPRAQETLPKGAPASSALRHGSSLPPQRRR